MTQAVVWLDLQNVRETGEETAEEKHARLRDIVNAYAYVDVLTSWDGWRHDRPGTFFVLDGPAHSVTATVDRLASGLYFAAYVVADLNEGHRAASPSYGIEEATP